MRFTTQLSVLAIAAIAFVQADEEAGKGKFELAGVEDEEFMMEPTRSGRRGSGRWEEEVDVSFDVEIEGRDRRGDRWDVEIDGEFQADWEGRRGRPHRRHHRCHKCGYTPCRCQKRKPEESCSDDIEAIEEENRDRLKITCPFEGQVFAACSGHSVDWDASALAEEGYTQVLGYYVGGKSCLCDKEREGHVSTIREGLCNGKVSDKNIIYLGCSTNIWSGTLNFNPIPYCLPDGYYQPVVIAFKQCDRVIRYVTKTGPWIRLFHDEGGQCNSPFKKCD